MNFVMCGRNKALHSFGFRSFLDAFSNSRFHFLLMKICSCVTTNNSIKKQNLLLQIVSQNIEFIFWQTFREILVRQGIFNTPP